jgi:hypothetical protein
LTTPSARYDVVVHDRSTERESIPNTVNHSVPNYHLFVFEYLSQPVTQAEERKTMLSTSKPLSEELDN